MKTSVVEGIDYTINEKGLLVFSRTYLLARGYCCDNGCQNCPYKSPKPDQRVEKQDGEPEASSKKG